MIVRQLSEYAAYFSSDEYESEATPARSSHLCKYINYVSMVAANVWGQLGVTLAFKV